MVRLFSPYHSVKVVTVVCFHSYSVLQLYMFLFKLFAETQKVAISFVRSVSLSALTTGLQLDRFFLKFDI